MVDDYFSCVQDVVRIVQKEGTNADCLPPCQVIDYMAWQDMNRMPTNIMPTVIEDAEEEDEYEVLQDDIEEEHLVWEICLFLRKVLENVGCSERRNLFLQRRQWVLNWDASHEHQERCSSCLRETKSLSGRHFPKNEAIDLPATRSYQGVSFYWCRFKHSWICLSGPVQLAVKKRHATSFVVFCVLSRPFSIAALIHIISTKQISSVFSIAELKYGWRSGEFKGIYERLTADAKCFATFGDRHEEIASIMKNRPPLSEERRASQVHFVSSPSETLLLNFLACWSRFSREKSSPLQNYRWCQKQLRRPSWECSLPDWGDTSYGKSIFLNLWSKCFRLKKCGTSMTRRATRPSWQRTWKEWTGFCISWQSTRIIVSRGEPGLRKCILDRWDTFSRKSSTRYA